MKNMDMDAWMESIRANRKRVAIPIMTHPGIELIGRTVYEAVNNGKVHFDGVYAPSVKEP